MLLKTVLLIAFFSVSVLGYDYYTFAVELPGAVCRSKNCDSSYLGNIADYEVNMHGLWPDSDDGSGVENCLTNNYDESELSSTVLKELNANWVGLYSSSSTFRSHEWGKHGTCWAQQNENPSTRRAFLGSGSYSTTYYQAMNDYFAKAIAVKKSLKIEDAIFTTKDGDATISLDDLESNLSQLLGVSNFNLYCTSQVLTEIRFCLDLDYAPIECSSSNIECSSESDITIVGTIN